MQSKEIVWDEKKNQINQTKHKISFEEATTVFFDPLSLTVDDPDHSWNEFRFITIDETKTQKLLKVFFTETETQIRIISARRPTKSERKQYEQ